MDDKEDVKRFDIDNVEYEADGTPIIPRIQFTVPRAYRKQFFQDMMDEVRSSPGEQLMAIFVKYMRMKRAELTASTIVPPGGDRRQIPNYGPKVLPSKAEINKQERLGA